MGNINSTIAFQSIQDTITDTVVSLEDFGFTNAEVLRAARAYIFVNTQSLRIDWSGNAPTTTSGAIVSGVFQLDGNENLQQLQLVRNSTNSAEVFIILEF